MVARTVDRNAVVGRIFCDAPLQENVILETEQLSTNKVRMITVLQDADKPNRNNRVYGKSVLENAINTPYIKEKLATNSLLGEMNHPPAGSSLARQMTIDMNNISHVIKEIYWDKSNPKLLLGKIETAGTDTGRNLAGLITENGMICSFSMRGGGDVVTRNGVSYVKDPLNIRTWDCVHFPSHKTAYMLNKLSEQSERIVYAHMIQETLQGEIATKSDNFKVIQESVSCFCEDFEIVSNGTTIQLIETATKQVVGVSLLERELQQDYANVVRSIFAKK